MSCNFILVFLSQELLNEFTSKLGHFAVSLLTRSQGERT